MTFPVSAWTRDAESASQGMALLRLGDFQLSGPVNLEIPPAIAAAAHAGGTGWSNPGQAGFAGMAHLPFAHFVGDTESDSQRDDTRFTASTPRSAERRSTPLGSSLSANATIDGMTDYYQQAFDILLTSGRLASARLRAGTRLPVRDRYGRGSTSLWAT